MQNPNNVQPTSTGQRGRKPSQTTPEKSVLSRSGRTVKTLSGPETINLLASESLSTGEESISTTAKRLSSEFKLGSSTPRSNAVARQGKVALQSGRFIPIDEESENLFFNSTSSSSSTSSSLISDIEDQFDSIEDIVFENVDLFSHSMRREKQINEKQVNKLFNKELREVGLKDKKYSIEEFIYVVDIQDEIPKVMHLNKKSLENAQFIMSRSGVILARTEEARQKLLKILALNDFQFDDDIDPAIKEEILSNIYYLNIIVVGEEKWNRVIRYIGMYQVIKKISKVEEENIKVDFEKVPKFPPLYDRDIQKLYDDDKLLNKFPAINTILNSNYFLIKLIDIIALILQKIVEAKNKLKEQERQEKLREIRKEFRALQDLRLEIKNKDLIINEIFQDSRTSFLEWLLWKDRKFLIFFGENKSKY